MLDAAGGRGTLILAACMLFASALPDAMVVPLLNELFVQRYGVSAAAAHWFMSINLVGAVAALPLLARLRRRWQPGTMLAIFAIVNAALLLTMWLPIGFGATIGLRFMEGAADLLVFAVLFDLFAKAGVGPTRGRRMGLAGTILMFGLFTGAVLGGRLGGGDPTDAFVVGAMACLLVALAAVVGGSQLRRLIQSCPAVTDTGAAIMTRRVLWPSLAMVGSDRAVAGLMTATLPFFFASVAELDPAARGWLIGLPLLLMAVGAWPAGWLGDRIGHTRLRLIAACLYAGSIALLPIVSPASFPGALGLMLIVGLSGAALLPNSLAIACESGRGSIAMGAHRSAGDAGYLLGIALAGTLLASLGGETPGAASYVIIITLFAGLHLFITAVTTTALWRQHRRSALG